MELFEKRVIIDIKMFHEIANGHNLSIALSLRNLGTSLVYYVTLLLISKFIANVLPLLLNTAFILYEIKIL